MNKHMGLWIDHRKAVLVLNSNPEDDVEVIPSEVEKDPSSPIPEDSQDRKYQNQLNVYYDEVIGHIHGAETLLIFGPGEAKGELQKRLAHTKPTERKVAVETDDKMTDRQVSAKVHAYIHRQKATAR